MVKVGRKFEEWVSKVLPDPLVIAIILTLIVGIAAVLLTPTSPVQVVLNWSKGFWELLTFAMQVAFGLIAGAALAQSPVAKRGMAKLCSLPKSAVGGVILLAVASAVLWFVNWGVGLIAGAFLSKEVAVQLSKKGVKYHLPMLAAGGFAGIITYEFGITGAVPLWIAAEGHRFVDDMGVIPLSETVFSPMNLICVAGLLILVPLCLCAMVPKDSSNFIMLDPKLVEAENQRQEAVQELKKDRTPAEQVEGMRFWSWAVFAMVLVYAAAHFGANGFEVDLNVFNLLLLGLAMLAWGRPLDFAQAFKAQTTQAWGVILQFPFYAGIMGIMTYSGLVPIIADVFVGIATPKTMSLIAFLSAGIVNFFVPSGGGQWAVQGPVMLEAGKQLGVSLKDIALAIGYGDSWTNLCSPFWALPIAGVLGIKVRDFMGYTVVVTLITGFLIGGILLFFA